MSSINATTKLQVNLSAQEQNGTITLATKGWVKEYPIIDNAVMLHLDIPESSMLSNYTVLRQEMRQAFVIPMYDAYIDIMPSVNYLENGTRQRKQVIFSAGPIASGGMCGESGATIHYLVYTNLDQEIKGRIFLTDVDLQLVKGWNVISDEREIFFGTKISSSSCLSSSIKIIEAPSSGWTPITEIIDIKF